MGKLKLCIMILTLLIISGCASTVVVQGCKEVEDGDDFDASVMKGVVAEDGSVTFEVDTAKQAAKVVAEKQKLVSDAYNLMNAEVLAEMSNVFGTTKPESASAYKDTWELMATSPADWTDKGINHPKKNSPSKVILGGDEFFSLFSAGC